MKLSIVIPTLNRREFLNQTVNSLLQTAQKVDFKYELIICDNASDDGTRSMVEQNFDREPSIKYIYFQERVDVVSSIVRAIESGTGEYIHVLGDDDFISTGFFEITSTILKEYERIGIIYFNRLIVDHTASKYQYVEHEEFIDGIARFQCKEFIEKFHSGPSFISSMIFKKEVWDNEKGVYMDDYPGFGFLARIYLGLEGYNCFYSSAPLVIQRKGIQLWKKHWPEFWLIGMGNLFRTLDERRITSNTLNNWITSIGKKSILKTLLEAKALGYKSNESFWTKVISILPKQYQVPVFAIRYCLSGKILKFMFNLLNKKYSNIQK